VTRLSLAQRHDPYWDVDGKSARRSRHQRQLLRLAVRTIAIVAIVVLATRLPAIDPTVVSAPEAKPILAAAVLSLLVVFMLLALVKMRSADPH
jgi:hypothetical protein